jgi:hypothetical protein
MLSFSSFELSDRIFATSNSRRNRPSIIPKITRQHRKTPSTTMKLTIPLTSALAALATATNPNNSNDCAVTDGKIDSVAYSYYSNGPNCAKNSDLGGIEDSIYHNLQPLDAAELSDCRCLKFNQGGAWEGWLMFGPAGIIDLAGFCGPVLDGRLDWDCSEGLRELEECLFDLLLETSTCSQRKQRSQVFCCERLVQ